MPSILSAFCRDFVGVFSRTWMATGIAILSRAEIVVIPGKN
jgi:hypothetical protein